VFVVCLSLMSRFKAKSRQSTSHSFPQDFAGAQDLAFLAHFLSYDVRHRGAFVMTTAVSAREIMMQI
jgi:hypothetical protein